MKQLAEMLLFYRKSKKLRQQDVADILHIPKQTYANYERDDAEPDCQTLLNLADFYGVSINQLMGQELSDFVLISKTQYEKLIRANDLLLDVLKSIKK